MQVCRKPTFSQLICWSDVGVSITELFYMTLMMVSNCDVYIVTSKCYYFRIIVLLTLTLFDTEALQTERGF